MAILNPKQEPDKKPEEIKINSKNTGLVVLIDGQPLNIFRKDYHLWLHMSDTGFARMKQAIMEHIQMDLK